VPWCNATVAGSETADFLRDVSGLISDMPKPNRISKMVEGHRKISGQRGLHDLRRLLLASMILLLSVISVIAAESGHMLPSGYLVTSGNQITDMTGEPVRLACVGYPALGAISTDIPAIAAAGFNCLRYPWFDATMTANLATADQIVAEAGKVGLKVIFDHHGDEAPAQSNGYLPFPCNGLPFDTGSGTDGTDGCGDVGTISRAQYVQDWVTFAKRYAGNPTVIGVDLTNEPHLSPWYWQKNPGGATWGDGSATDLRAIYEQAGNAIQTVNPGVLIIAEGIINQTSTLLDGTPNAIKGATDLTLAVSKPVRLSIPHKLVYSIHEYPTSISATSPDSGTAKIQSMNTTWGYLVTKNIAPVWIGEMGASLDGSGRDSTGDKLQDEKAWSDMIVAYTNGQEGAHGGPTFTGHEKGIGTDWWWWVNMDSGEPDGILDKQGRLRPEQKSITEQLR
jgi:endoglucanase